MEGRGKRILFIFVISFILILPNTIFAQEKLVEVVAENARIYAEPNATSEIIQAAPVGQVYDMIRKVGAWYEIRFTTERLGITMTGYIHERYVKILGEEMPVQEARRAAPGKKDIRILFEAVGSYFQPSDQVFKSIYGSGTYFGGEINIRLASGVSLWAGAHMFSKDGLTTFTEEPTEIAITPVYGGLKFRVPSAKVSPYLGLGVGYFQYKETSAIGEVQKGDIGYIGQLGILINVIGPIYLDLKGCYSYCKVQPEELEADLGGFQVIGGFGFGF